MPASRPDLIVAGGGCGGVAAALAALEGGCRVLLVERHAWLGGQLTSQAVPPDEHPWIEELGCTRRYRRYRDLVRELYRRHYPLTAAARAEARLNPGSGRVSALCHEPRVGAAAIEEILAPWVARDLLEVWRGWEPSRVERRGSRILAVEFRKLADGELRSRAADYVVDATETGQLLPLAGLEWVSGAESRSDTGELHAPELADPRDTQAFSWSAALSYDPAGRHAMDKPPSYERWRNLVPRLSPPLPYEEPLLTWSYALPGRDGRLEAREARLFEPSGRPSAWNYRSILDPRHFEAAAGLEAASILLWSQNDCFFGSLLDESAERRREAERDARELSLSLVYWLKTEAPRHDGGFGYPELRLRGDLLGTEDGLAMAPYVRESRRIVSRRRVTEGDVGFAQREGRPAEAFRDTVGIGFYNIDLHPSASGRNTLNLRTMPFQIPLGSLLPRDCDNLLAGGKDMGTTHLTNGCYRLHPVEWNVGEAAGALAAFCLRRGQPPAALLERAGLLGEFQEGLRRDGFELSWPEELVEEVRSSASLYLH
jgi:hypothetical protein